MEIPEKDKTPESKTNAARPNEMGRGVNTDKETAHGGRGSLLTAGLIGTVILAAFVLWRWLEAAGVGVLFDRFGPLAPLVSIPVHVLLSATPFPSELIGVANGSVYGLWLGTLYGWFGWWCGALLEYALVRRGAREIEWDDAESALPRWLSRFPVDHPVFLIVGRQLPFGFHAVNILAGLSGVSARRQLACAAISNLPYAFLSASAGAGLIAAWSGSASG